MKLSERMRQRENAGTEQPTPRVPTGPGPPAPSSSGLPPQSVPGAALDLRSSAEFLPTSKAEPQRARTADPLAFMKVRIHDALFARLGTRLFDSSLSEEQVRHHVTQEIGVLMDAERAPLSATQRQELAAEMCADVLGYGPIERFLADPTITEVMVNGDQPIYIERAGQLEETTSRFMSNDHLRRVIERIVSDVGRRIDESSAMVDARLPDGSRVNAIIPPLAVDGPALTVRKFARDPLQISDLVRFGTLTPRAAALLHACVWGKLNILISGGTGTGKTTLLNVMSSFIPVGERIVTIEDAVELQMHQRHVVRLEARPPNAEGRGEVSVRELVRNALRMRPDRIVVGEVRGGEALDMLQAMNTGHEGSLSTVHSNGPRDALARLETMVLMSGLDLPMRAIREQIASALDLIVHISRLRDGTRRVTHISEVTGMESGVITLQDIYAFDYSAGIAADGRYLGSIEPTGLRPKIAERLREQGVNLPADLFGAVDPYAPTLASSR